MKKTRSHPNLVQMEISQTSRTSPLIALGELEKVKVINNLSRHSCRRVQGLRG